MKLMVNFLLNKILTARSCTLEAAHVNKVLQSHRRLLLSRHHIECTLAELELLYLRNTIFAQHTQSSISTDYVAITQSIYSILSIVFEKAVTKIQNGDFDLLSVEAKNVNRIKILCDLSLFR